MTKLDFSKGVFPEFGLGLPGFIQRSISMADETAGAVPLNLPVAQQKYAGAAI